MEVERVVSAGDQIELWLSCQPVESRSENKLNRKFIGYEQPLNATYSGRPDALEIICWSRSSTLGNVPIYNPAIIGGLTSEHGIGLLGCDIVEAGKMRNGAQRWWCRTHQKHWGTKKDLESAWSESTIRCANYAQLMTYVVDPLKLRLESFTDVEIWCSFPPALTSAERLVPRGPHVFVRARGKYKEVSDINASFEAVTLIHAQSQDLFDTTYSDEVHLTPTAVKEFTLALENALPIGCVNCQRCGYPHQDLGDFGRKAHKKHLCSNCGRDSIWTPVPIVSTPLSTIQKQFDLGYGFEEATSSINLDECLGASFNIWPTMPAVLWSHDHPQKRGIRVELAMDGKEQVNEIFGEVILNGKMIERAKLIELMLSNTLP